MTLLMHSTIKKFCHLRHLVRNDKTLATIKDARCGDLGVLADLDDLLKKLNAKPLSFLHSLASLSN